MVNSMDAETPNDSIIVENGKEDQLDMAYCSVRPRQLRQIQLQFSAVQA